ncbi:fimbrial protein, partial [Escherichia coli]|nr:fimbrial protein [Escherichia coli]
DGNGSHASTLKSPSYTKSVSWQHYPQGVGVQLTRNGTIIPANYTVSLGAVGTSAVSLGLTANYARTGGQVTAGNVQSIIGVTFVYQ